jgi:type IV pilus assembly protein PilA
MTDPDLQDFGGWPDNPENGSTKCQIVAMENRRKKLCLPKQYVTRLVILPVTVFIISLNAVILIGFVREEPFFISLATSGSAVLVGALELVLVALAVGFLVITTHRIAGPMRAMEQALQTLGQGNFDAHVSFRKHDFFHDVAQAFDETSAELRTRILRLQRVSAELIECPPGDPEVQERIAHLHRELMALKATPLVTPEEPVARKQFPPGTSAGFTLVELMVVVTIVSILLVTAMPMYSNYTIRSRVTEGLNMMGPVQQTVSEFYFTNARMPADNTEAGMSAPTGYATKEVSRIEVDDGQARLYFAIADLGAYNTIVFSPRPTGGRIDWNCSGGTLLSKYRPPACH